MGRTKGKKRQSRLAFAPVEEDPRGRPSPTSSSFTPSRLRYAGPLSGNVTIKGQLQLEDYTRNRDPDERNQSDDHALVGAGQVASEVIPNQKPKKSYRTHSRLPTSPRPISNTPHQDNPSSSSSDLEVVQPSKRRRIQTITLSDSESDQPILSSAHSHSKDNGAGDKELRMGKKTSPRRSERLKGSSSPDNTTPRSKSLEILSELGEPEETASDELASPSTYRKRKGRPCKPKASPAVVIDNSEDSDAVITTGRKPKKLKTDVAKPQTKQSVDLVTDNDEDSSDDDIIAFTPSRRASQKSRLVSSNSDDDEGSPKTPTKLPSGQDRLDLEEDLEDLRDTDLREKRTRGATVNSARSARQKHLEVLRRRRAGEKDAADPSGVEDVDEEYDYEKETHKNAVNSILNWVGLSRTRGLGENDDGDGDSNAVSEVDADEDLDTDDSSFVDKDGELGAPVDLPFEFSRHRKKSTRDCFRDVIEWMVHSKLNPAFPRNDEMYQFAFQKVDDEVVGRVGSQLVSTVWNADFRNALIARPYLEVQGCDSSASWSCQACNRSGHWVSADLRLSGKPYSEETLEPLHESDSDSNNDSETVEDDGNPNNESASTHRNRDRDREGHILPPEDRHYYLGRTCKSNAVLSHTLIHWRFHLYEWVVDYLDRKEELLSSPQRSLEREKLSAKKRTKYANKVMDRMDAGNEVQRLWNDFHQTLKVARTMKDNDEHPFFGNA